MCRLDRRRPKPTCPPARTTPGIVCPPCDSAEGEGVQSAAELRHVQGHDHEKHVFCALPAQSRTGPQAFSWGPARACAACGRRRPIPTRLCRAARTSARVVYMPSPFDSAGGGGVQSAAELRHVQGRDDVRHVSGPLRACLEPQPLRPSPCICRSRRPPPHTRPPAFVPPMFRVRSAICARPPSLNLVGRSPRACDICVHPARLRPAAHLSPVSLCLPFDSTGGERVQSAAELRHV